jgi:hypothetical protein
MELKKWLCALAMAVSLSPHASAQQAAKTVSPEQKARALLDAMVSALGGHAWLDMQDYQQHGRSSSFFQGRPTGQIVEFWFFHRVPDFDRYEYTKKRDVIQIYTPQQGYEVTFKGVEDLPALQQQDYLRRRAHSVEIVMRSWLKDPNTLLLYEGQTMVERRPADKVTIVTATNDAVTFEINPETHLPLRRTFEWRDPLYKDKNEEAEEYDDYHVIQGFPTAFAITRYHNGEMINQRFLYDVKYNTGISATMFDPAKVPPIKH